mmetsp:Transcript_112252/g.217507  ORF Transcript_112252/g.217507 Transcript_112252/m.217507 type:complete len:233 (-) Transcript_112252:838-1536(-)
MLCRPQASPASVVVVLLGHTCHPMPQTLRQHTPAQGNQSLPERPSLLPAPEHHGAQGKWLPHPSQTHAGSQGPGLPERAHVPLDVRRVPPHIFRLLDPFVAEPSWRFRGRHQPCLLGGPPLHAHGPPPQFQSHLTPQLRFVALLASYPSGRLPLAQLLGHWPFGPTQLQLSGAPLGIGLGEVLRPRLHGLHPRYPYRQVPLLLQHALLHRNLVIVEQQPLHVLNGRRHQMLL